MNLKQYITKAWPLALSSKELYAFGKFRLDGGQRLLFRDGEVIPLAPKALDTLLVLVESEGEVVEKEELLKRIWQDTFVEEGSLAQNISILRKVLGEDSNGQPYIQTIPKLLQHRLADLVHIFVMEESDLNRN